MWFFVVIVVFVVFVFVLNFFFAFPSERELLFWISFSLGRDSSLFFYPGRCPGLLDVALTGLKKAAYRVPISRFLFIFYAMIATSFHGIAKSYCATTKCFSSNSSSYIFQAYFIKTKNLLLRSRPIYF